MDYRVKQIYRVWKNCFKIYWKCSIFAKSWKCYFEIIFATWHIDAEVGLLKYFAESVCVCVRVKLLNCVVFDKFNFSFYIFMFLAKLA